MTNFLIEILATLIYMFVLFPMFIVLNLFYMILVVLLLPLKIPVINRWVRNYLKRENKHGII